MTSRRGSRETDFVKRPIVLGAAAVSVAFLLVGCTPTAPVQTAKGALPAHSATAVPTAIATPSPTPTSSYIADDPATYILEDDSTYSWITPSRNMACGIESVYYQNSNDHTMWGCEVDKHSWVTPHAKAGDFCYNAQIPCGTGVVAIDAQVPTPSEHGDERYPSEEAMFGNTTPIALATRTLPYGHSITVGTITCVSLATGMTCSNTVGGHGFTVSASVYESH